MPEDILDNEQQTSTTPHFDAFSGRDSEIASQPVQDGPFVDDESMSRPLIQDTNTDMSAELPAQPVVPASESLPESIPVNVSNPAFPQNIQTTQPVVESQQSQPVMQAFAPAPVVPIPEVNPVINNFAQPVPQVVNTGGLNGLLKNKPLIIGIIVVVVLAIIGGVSALAISAYQDPQKVITDGIMNSMTAKSAVYEGQLTIDQPGGDNGVKVEITSKSNDTAGSLNAKVEIEVEGNKFSANGDALFDKEGDLYFKVGGLKALVDEAAIQYGITDSYPGSLAAVEKLIDRIDDKWIKISNNDIEQFSKELAETQTCINDVMKKYRSDKPAIAEVTDLYKEHKFIVVDKKLGEKDGSFGYIIDTNEKEAELFSKGLMDTKIFKSINDCDKSLAASEGESGDFVTDTITTSTDDKGTLELWVSVWSHEITKIEYKNKDSNQDSRFIIEPKYNQSLDISTPKSSISLSELKTYIDDFMTAMEADSSSQYDAYTDDYSYYSDDYTE